jgi:hypothetical protein
MIDTHIVVFGLTASDTSRSVVGQLQVLVFSLVCLLDEEANWRLDRRVV